jgi:hypothetical protein
VPEPGERFQLTNFLLGLHLDRVPGYRSGGPGFDGRCCQISGEAVGLEWGPLSFIRIIEELFERKCNGYSPEN